MKRHYTKEMIIEEIDAELKPLKDALGEKYERRHELSKSWINNNERDDIDQSLILLSLDISLLEKIKTMVKRLKK